MDSVSEVDLFVDRILDIVEVDYRGDEAGKREQLRLVVADIVAGVITGLERRLEPTKPPKGELLGTFTRAGGIRP